MISGPDLQNPRLNLIFETLSAASLMAREIQGATSSETLQKSDRSPVTVADFSVQALLGRRLMEQYPSESLVAEESTQQLRDNSLILHQIRAFLEPVIGAATLENILQWIDHGGGEPVGGFWTLDPVDGTKGYLRGEHFAVALAWIVDGEVQMAGLGCPRLSRPGSEAGGLIYLAMRGQGCWCGQLGSYDFEACKVSDCMSLKEARILRSVEKAHINLDLFARLRQQIGSQGTPVEMDSQAKYAALASGWGEAVVRLQSRPDYREKIWDQAAGSLIVEEAGGRVTDQRGRPLDFSQGKRLERNQGVVATNGRLHGELIEMLAGKGSRGPGIQVPTE